MGHDVHSFENEGWTLLNVIVSHGRTEAAVAVMNEIFLSFTLLGDSSIVDSARFGPFFSAFYKSPSHLDGFFIDIDQKKLKLTQNLDLRILAKNNVCYLKSS